jgi:K+-sensing histidine kinase KdpD
MYNLNDLDRQGLAMLERERREDQTDRLVILPTARGHSGRGGQQRFAGRIKKSPREVLIRSIALSLAAILLTTVLVAEAYSHATALHIRDPEDLALAFLLPTVFIAVFFGSTFAVASSFVSGLAAAYVIYPPEASIWIHDPNHVAELGFIVLLAITASKAVGVIIDGNCDQSQNREGARPLSS